MAYSYPKNPEERPHRTEIAEQAESEAKRFVCDNCEECVAKLVVYNGDKVCERCRDDWATEDAGDASFEFHHASRFQ